MRKASSIGAGWRVLVHVFLIVLVVASILPLYNVIAASFKSADEFVANPFLPPRLPIADNYAYAIISARLLRFAVNSLILVPLGLVLYLAVCVAAGYAFGKMRFRLRLPLFLLVLFLTIFPQLLLATQVFKLISLLHLVNTGVGVILSWVAYFSPFGTYIMTTYFTDMPYELVEAARMDGASPLRILVQVMTPMAMPMIATIAIIGFQSMWNELPFSLLILQNQTSRTLTLGIAMMRGEFGLRVPILSAAVVIAMSVPLVIFFIFQRRVTLGVTAGAIKG
ncbi:MAG: carbohydrate ABC transporter permease [Spirochaetia bacterium]|jgi:ABC-type glycerol-3-phosphate transport system permease component